MDSSQELQVFLESDEFFRNGRGNLLGDVGASASLGLVEISSAHKRICLPYQLCRAFHADEHAHHEKASVHTYRESG
ncbi:hypothetical protein MUK42_23886, partial [Musa troglodytarum]